MTNEEKIERVKFVLARDTAIDLHIDDAKLDEVVRITIAELKAIEAEDATPPANTPAERWDLVRGSYEAATASHRTPERT
jgi:hypothetical protein